MITNNEKKAYVWHSEAISGKMLLKKEDRTYVRANFS